MQKNDIIIGYAPQEIMAAIAIQEMLEMTQVRVLMAPITRSGPEGKQLLNSLSVDGRMAVVLCGTESWPSVAASAMWQALYRRNPQYHPALIHFLWLAPTEMAEAVPNLPDLPHLPWEWSFRAVCEAIRTKLIEQGWSAPSVKKPREKSATPSPQSIPEDTKQSIHGSHNIQIGGDVRAGRDNKFNSK